MLVLFVCTYYLKGENFKQVEVSTFSEEIYSISTA